MTNRNSRAGRLRAGIAIGVPVFALLWLGSPNVAPSQAEPIEYSLLSIDVGGQSKRMHRFRVRVAEMRAEVFDLGFKIPVAGWLGDSVFAVNGGYWEWHLGKPRMIGWVVSGGKQLSPLRKKLDGGVLLVRDGRASIVTSSAIEPKAAGVELAVQCRPRLVENGKVVPHLHPAGHSIRTAVCTRDAGATLDVFLSDPRDRGPTLAGLGTWLAAQGCRDALNLDGGPSTAAAFRRNDGVMKIGHGTHLPYAIRFVPRRPHNH